MHAQDDRFRGIFQSIEAALSSLRGLPMWAAGWAGDIAWFEFGAEVLRPGYRGKSRTVGEYALHLSCSWRWLAPSGFPRADDNSPPAALEALSESTPRYAGVELMDSENLAVKFDNSDVLVVEGFPHSPAYGAASDASKHGDAEEYWRILRPGLGRPHFVVSSSGVGWYEV